MTFWAASKGPEGTVVEITRFPAESQSSPAVATPVSTEWSGPRPSPSLPKGTNEVSPVSRQKKAVAETPRVRPTPPPSQGLNPSSGASVTTVGEAQWSRQGDISRSNRTSRTTSRKTPSSLWSRQSERSRSQPGIMSPGLAAGQRQGSESAKREAHPGRNSIPRPPVRGSMPQVRRPR